MTAPARRPELMTTNLIEVSPDIPFAVLLRICGEYGTVRICRGQFMVAPSDADAAHWIVRTLSMLGYTTNQRKETLMAERETCLLSIADSTGDTRIMWDPRDKDEVKVAKEAFDKAKAKGMLAYAVDEATGERKGEVIREFDPARSKIIMTKQLTGG